MTLLAYLPRFREARRQAPLLAAREDWSREEIESHQLERLNAVWSQAARCVPYYRRLREKQHLPDAFASLDEYQASVPLLSKKAIAKDRFAFLSDNAPRGAWHRTSGSTGVPLSVFRAHRDHREMLRTRYRFYAMWGVDIFDRVAWVWSGSSARHPGLTGFIPRIRERMEDRLRNRLRIPAKELGREDLRAHLPRIARFRPIGMYGFSRAVYLLARMAEETGFHCDSLRAVFLTGEAAPPYLAQAVQRAFDAPAVVEYGSVDCGFIAGQWPDGTFRVREDIVLVETLPRGEGLFEVVVTPLTSSAFPLLRYRIGDFCQAPLRRPERGFAMLGSIAGRNDDLVQTRTGRYVHAACIDELFEVEHHALVRRYRVHQDASGKVAAMVEFTRPASRDDASRIAVRLSRLLDDQPVTVEVVDAVPQTAAGKHRLVTSELCPTQTDSL